MPKAFLICGKICCGKTTYAQKLCNENNAVLLSVDEITLALFGQHCGDKHDEYVERTEKYLASVGLTGAFDKLISGYMVQKGKPEPDIYELAAKEIGFTPQECLAIEDSPSGLLSANRAGCYPVMIPDQDLPTSETEALLFAKADSLEKIIFLLKWLEN